MTINAPFTHSYANITFQGPLIEARLYYERQRDLISSYEELHGEVETLNTFNGDIQFLEHPYKKLRGYPDLWVLT